ncbi:MAG: flagellar hook protein FlgE [Rhodospirillaceae bacterium]|nr:flagellar hook protein FlgE [Rhodospirillaceae bacterium]
MSSLSSALTVAVSALTAQSKAVSAISTNLANSETVGYKTTDASFASLVTGSGSAQTFTGAGAVASPKQNISAQGLLTSSDSELDLGIDGNGFFVVSDQSDGSSVSYTRVGDFATDAEGYLINSNGFYLLAYPTDADGSSAVGASSLEPININDLTGLATPTTELAVQGILPAEAAVGTTVETEVEIYDSLGIAHALTLTYTKTDTNEWTLAAEDPVLASATSTVSGTASGGGTITFNSDGSIASTSPAALEITIANWTTGAADSGIDYAAGTAGTTSLLSQTASDSTTAITVKSVSQDGVAYGVYQSLTIDDNGRVYANYDNGVSQSIYQIPLATFANPDGLEAQSGNTYTATILSGAENLTTPGTAGAGSIQAGTLESSTVDTAAEFSKLIVAQQAYSAASEIISTTQEMFDSLVRAKA